MEYIGNGYCFAAFTKAGMAEPATTTPTSRTSPGAPNAGLSIRNRVILGASIGASLVAILSVGFCMLTRYRWNKRQKSLNKPRSSGPDRPPYLQRKGELDARDNGRYELFTKERGYELENENAIHEAPANRSQMIPGKPIEEDGD